MTTPEIFILIIIFLIGGIVKGTLGIGLPALLIGLLTVFYEPRTAVAMILFVIMTTNMRQAAVGGSIWEIILRHRYFCIFASIGIFFVALVGSKVPLPVLLSCVGVAVTIFALSSLFANIPKLDHKYDKAVQITAGVSSGILGGLTAIWGPPLAMYLMSLKLEKDRMIQTLGVMFSVQSIFLTAGFVVSGELTGRIAILGAVLIIPAFVGMYFGEKIRASMNTVLFMRAFLIVFLLLGLNLIRRGILGG